jgi:hypothetical protein
LKSGEHIPRERRSQRQRLILIFEQRRTSYTYHETLAGTNRSCTRRARVQDMHIHHPLRRSFPTHLRQAYPLTHRARARGPHRRIRKQCHNWDTEKNATCLQGCAAHRLPNYRLQCAWRRCCRNGWQTTGASTGRGRTLSFALRRHQRCSAPCTFCCWLAWPREG